MPAGWDIVTLSLFLRLKDPSHTDGAGMAGDRPKSTWLITHSPICSLMLVERYPYRSDIKAFHTHVL